MAGGLGSLVVSLGLNATDFTQGLNKAEQQAVRFNESMSRVGKIAAGALVGVAVTVGTEIAAIIKEQAKAIDAFNDLKDATGASIENISALDSVARRTGGDFATVETSLIKFNAALNAATPDSPGVRALRAIGLSAAELKRLDPAEALRQTAVALSAFADDGNKARLTQELFGKSLKEVAPFLKDLSEQQQLVAKTTTAQAEEAEKFNKNLFELKAKSTDFARSLVNDVLPALNALLDGFKKSRDEGTLFLDMLRKTGTLLSGKLTLDVAFGEGSPAEEAARLREQLDATNKLLETGNLSTERRNRLLNRQAQLQTSLASAQRAALAPGFEATAASFAGAKPSVNMPEKKDKAEMSEAQRYLETLQKQAEKIEHMTTLERALNDIQKGRLDGITPKLKAQITAQAKVVDQMKYEEQQRHNLDEALQANLQARLRTVDAALSDAKSLLDGNEAMEREIQTIGASTEALYALEKARISSAIALKQEALLAVTAEEANLGLDRALLDQIEQLERRKVLLDDKKTAEAFTARMQQMEDDLRSVRDTFESTLGQGLVDVLDGNFKSIGDLFARTLKRMAADAAAANITKAIFGESSGRNVDWSSLLAFFGPGGITTGGSSFSQTGDMIHGRHAAGLAYVPFDGYRAELHKGERVMTAQENRRGGGNIYITNVGGAQVSARRDNAGDFHVLVKAAAEQARNMMVADHASGTGPSSRALRARGVGLDGNLSRRG